LSAFHPNSKKENSKKENSAVRSGSGSNRGKRKDQKAKIK
jgi:hypothetical protein